jgi:hypothetical protein
VYGLTTALEDLQQLTGRYLGLVDEQQEFTGAQPGRREGLKPARRCVPKRQNAMPKRADISQLQDTSDGRPTRKIPGYEVALIH